MNDPSQHKFEGEGMLGALHKFFYPPTSKYFWYRRGKVKQSPLSTKYLRFLVLTATMSVAGSGAVMFGIMLLISLMMSEWFSITRTHTSLILSAFAEHKITNITQAPMYQNASYVAEKALQHDLQTSEYMKTLISDPYFIVSWMFTAGTSTLLIYYYCASALHNQYYVDRRDEAEQWKCQPKKFPTDALFLEEQLTGCFNGFVSGFAGTGLFFYHLNYPFLKFHYTMELGWGRFMQDCCLVYLWIDFYSYWMHRTLHHRFFYKRIHKWHHRYKQPTAFGAFAIHPIEYIAFQTAGIWCAAIFPMHVMAFLVVVTGIAYENMKDHSGVHFEGTLFWFPGTLYHDDHHQYFHLNFGVTLILWDWLFGTLRQKDRHYNENTYVGEQDKKVQ
uniref:Fatty acid hydroxylase domain-containing protein n=1 Tax=Mucochytrium quahogii TaxID=96639 RepID=A0A7S2RYA1_9STRA|mmetsp:Transcript_3107/g.4454  ORF Transcript_3107/g.4454 Transcript_3107/m.4454 type:complete len:388 (-) Transcript_3107:89-1252(-)|eukprot:CAMPEP_0203749062 /NCGR_PEP_ID=MMETSP0098-20131031/3751_1 /ASSEMBLY_ACC=CAM_ASM_000208 /TAXON_ID=96639 /ORGANISM=" , Strain NY0313808BC1" /LENGTH=387 /DNA_ID=CAMNT_0050638005 /DNA_START=327 /DNA_END=1490 /DNA_ORIENTATION=-